MPLKPGKHAFTSSDGELFHVRVPEAADMDSFFVFSFPRCGSTLLDRMLRQICDGTETPYITIADDAFADGVPSNRIAPSIESILSPRGFGYLGFRHFFSFDPQFDFSPFKKVLLMRDPRDMMVSLFFSVKHSHAIPKQGEASKRMKESRDLIRNVEINDYMALGAQHHAQRFIKSVNRYRQFVFDDRLRIYNYEKVIFEKAAWLRDLADYLSIPASDELIARVAAENDIVPEKEDPSAHIRQVRPGNYKQHLSEASIAMLNEEFAEVLELFGYEP